MNTLPVLLEDKHLPAARMSIVEVQRRPLDFQQRALNEPVLITVRGEPKLVAMSADAFAQLSALACSAQGRRRTEPE